MLFHCSSGSPNSRHDLNLFKKRREGRQAGQERGKPEVPRLLICPCFLSAEQHLGEKAPAKEKGSPWSRDPEVRARSSLLPSLDWKCLTQEQDDGCFCLCESNLGCRQAPTNQPTPAQGGSRGAQPKCGVAVTRSAGEPAGKHGL